MSFQILRLSATFRLSHLLRTVPPSITCQAAANYDALVERLLASIIAGDGAAAAGLSVSAIGGGGDTTIPSPGRSPKQPLPGKGLHDPLNGRHACPKFNSFHRGVGQTSPREGVFSCRPLPKRGQICDIPAPPPQSLNDSAIDPRGSSPQSHRVPKPDLSGTRGPTAGPPADPRRRPWTYQRQLHQRRGLYWLPRRDPGECRRCLHPGEPSIPS